MKQNPFDRPADPTPANPITIAHPTPLQWPHKGNFESLDMASVRRGYEVYKQVCSACHSMKYRYYRHFSDPEFGFMTEEEAKAEAAEALIDDLSDKGQPIKRPGKLIDRLPSPYPNKIAAEAANIGKYPPDFSTIMLARRPHGFAPRFNTNSNEDYIFSILTGYMDAPAGVKVDDGQAYNPYFPGGVIAMPQQLFDDGIEYKDGTPATQSQQAKDICSFLRWSAEPFHDKRKEWALKGLVLLPLVTVIILYMKKHTWSLIKSQKVKWHTVKGREPPSSQPKST
uniref:Cytochrome c domain-containing protein n=1 Tax=Acrobeloides nanus TaxID=290746 RepID=A0A914CCU2_9BILA